MVKYLNRKNLRANKTKLIAAVGLAMAIIIMTTSNQLSIFASSTTEDDGNNNDEIPYCDEADPGYNGTLVLRTLKPISLHIFQVLQLS
jgi:hypothetical protein